MMTEPLTPAERMSLAFQHIARTYFCHVASNPTSRLEAIEEQIELQIDALKTEGIDVERLVQ